MKSLSFENDEEPLWLDGKLVEGIEASSDEDPSLEEDVAQESHPVVASSEEVPKEEDEKEHPVRMNAKRLPSRKSFRVVVIAFPQNYF